MRVTGEAREKRCIQEWGRGARDSGRRDIGSGRWVGNGQRWMQLDPRLEERKTGLVGDRFVELGGRDSLCLQGTIPGWPN